MSMAWLFRHFIRFCHLSLLISPQGRTSLWKAKPNEFTATLNIRAFFELYRLDCHYYSEIINKWKFTLLTQFRIVSKLGKSKHVWTHPFPPCNLKPNTSYCCGFHWSIRPILFAFRRMRHCILLFTGIVRTTTNAQISKAKHLFRCCSTHVLIHLYRSIHLNTIVAVLYMYNGCVCYTCACIMIEIHSAIVNTCGAGIITYQVGFITMCIDFSSFSYRNYNIND